MPHNVLSILRSSLNACEPYWLVAICIITALVTCALYTPLHTQVHELGHVVAIKRSAKPLGYALKDKIKISNRFFKGATSSDFYAYLASKKYCMNAQRAIMYNAIAGLIATFYLQLFISIFSGFTLLLVTLLAYPVMALIVTVFALASTTFSVIFTILYFISSDWKTFRHPELFEYKSAPIAAPTTSDA